MSGSAELQGPPGTGALDPVTGAPSDVQKVLCFAAHPDDIDFGASGTLARWAAADLEIALVVFTGGDAGGFSDKARGDDVVAIRNAEQRQAATAVGIHHVEVWDFPDGDLQPSRELTKRIIEAGRIHRPDLIMSPHPERDFGSFQKSHPDHLVAGQAVTYAVYPGMENRYAFPELIQAGLEPHRLRHLWYFSQPEERTNLAVDISAFMDTKVRALNAHTSQHPDPERMRTWVRERAAEAAAAYPWWEHDGTSRYAESFHAVSVNSAETIAGF